MDHPINDVAVIAAQQKAMERGGKTLSHGCMLYTVQDWEGIVLSRDRNIATVDTLLTLERALSDPEKNAIFIPADAMMTDQDIEKICRRTGVSKSLFKEVKQA